MRRHFLISFATDGVHDHGVDLIKQAVTFKNAGNSFDVVKIFTSEELILIASEYNIVDPLKDQSEAFKAYKKGGAIHDSDFKCNPNWLRVNSFLFKPLLVHYALHNIVGTGDLLTWHDCNVEKNPHYIMNVGPAGKGYLEECAKERSVSLFSDTLCGICYDIKPSLTKLIYDLELSRVLPSLRVNVFSISNDSFGRQYSELWLGLSLNDDYRLPFPDDLPHPSKFRCHAQEQATAFFTAAILCKNSSFRKRLNHTFLWHTTHLPPRKWQILGSLVKRSHLRFNLRLLKLIRHYPYRWHQFRDSIESTKVLPNA